MTLLIVLVGLVGAAIIIAIYIREEVKSYSSGRRFWHSWAQYNYELDRIRDHFFEHLTADDVAYLMREGWTPPAEVARTWKEVARYRRIANMTPAELDALLKCRAAGIHVTAHPDDLRFSA